MPTTPSGARPARVGVLAGVAVALTAGAWALASPLMSVPDEPAHTYKAAAVVRGQLRGAEEVRHDAPPGELNYVRTHVRLDRGYAELAELPLCYIGRPEVTAACAPPVSGADEPAVVRTLMGRYPPLYYGLVGIPTVLAETAAAVYGARLLGALLAAVLIGAGAAALWWLERSPLLLAGLGLAVTPMAVYLAGAVNASGLEIAAAIGWWSAGLALLAAPTDRELPGWLLVTAAATAIAFAWSRPASLALLAVSAAVLVLAVGDAGALRERWRDRRVRATAAAAGVGVAGAGAWVVLADPLSSFTGMPHPELTVWEAARSSLDRTTARLREMIGWFGWLDTPAPRPLLDGWLLVAAALGAAAVALGRWRQRLALLALAAGAILLPVIAEARAAQEIGFSWQGRYTLPLAVGVPVLAAWVVVRRGRRTLATALLTTVLGAAAAVGHAVAFGAALHRFSVGAGAPPLAFLTDPVWVPPVPTAVLTGMLVAGLFVAAGGLAVLGGRARRAAGSAPTP